MKTDSQFSRWLRLPTFLIAVVWSGQLYATTFVSTQSGNWSNPATWGGAGFPGCGDTVIVSVGTTVTDDATNCSSDLTVNGTLSMANNFFDFEGTTFTNNGAVISTVGYGEVDFNGVGGAQGTTQHLAGTGTYNTDGRVDFHSRDSGFVVPASGTVLNGITNWTIDVGSTLFLTNDFVVNGLTGVGQAIAFVNSGTISGTGIMKAHNNVVISGGGTMSAPLEVVAGTTIAASTTLGAVTVDSDATLLEGGTMRPLGDLTVLSGGTMDMADNYLDFEGATFTNNGAVISSVPSFGEVDFNGVGGAQGTTQHLAGTGTYNTNGRVDFYTRDSTTVVPASGTVLNGITNWTIDVGSTLFLTNDFVVNGLTGVGQAIAFVNSGTISGTGIMKAHNNVVISGGGTMSAPLEVVAGTTIAASTTLGAVTVDSDATLLEGGTMRPLGDLTVLSGGTMDMADNYLDFEGATFTNNGAVISSVPSFGEVDFNGVGGAQGTTQHLAGTGTYNTNGLVALHIRQLTSVTIADGALVDGVFDNSIDGGSTLTNNGTMAPGFPPGQAIINGNLQLGSTSNLSFDIGGTTPVTDYDLFDKTDGGALTLNGDLAARLINDFTPSPSDTFTIYQTQVPLQGSFSNVASGGRLNTVGGDGSFVVTYTGANAVTLSSFGPTVCVTPPPDMISWWPGDGDANDIQDGNNGTVQGNITFVAGKVDQAFSSNSPAGSALIGNPTNLQLETFTFDTWIKLNPATLTGGGPSVISYGSGGYGFGVAGSSQPPRVSGEPFLTQVGSSNVGPGPGMVIADQNWHHIAVTKDGSTVVFYLDGVASEPQNYNATFIFMSNAVIASSDQPDPVLFDEIEVFNRALTPPEIQSIYNAGIAGKCRPSHTPTPTPTPTPSGTPSGTPRVIPTPRSRPSPRTRPTPPPHLTPVPPPPSPRPTPVPRPTPPPHLTPVPPPPSPRPTPPPRP